MEKVSFTSTPAETFYFYNEIQAILEDLANLPFSGDNYYQSLWIQTAKGGAELHAKNKGNDIAKYIFFIQDGEKNDWKNLVYTCDTDGDLTPKVIRYRQKNSTPNKEVATEDQFAINDTLRYIMSIAEPNATEDRLNACSFCSSPISYSKVAKIAFDSTTPDFIAKQFVTVLGEAKRAALEVSMPVTLFAHFLVNSEGLLKFEPPIEYKKGVRNYELVAILRDKYNVTSFKNRSVANLKKEDLKQALTQLRNCQYDDLQFKD